MRRYAYMGRDQVGRVSRGVLEADDERAVRDILRRRGILVTETQEEGKKEGKQLKVPAQELARVTGQLASMLEAALPLGRCLQILKSDTEDPSMRALIQGIAADVGSGTAFSAALAKYPQVFSEFYVGLVVAGERSGYLSRTLARVGAQLEATQELNRKVRQAFAYPAIVSAVGLVVVIFLVAKVVPVFENVYRQLGAELPLPTVVLLVLSRFLRSYGVALAIALPFLILGTRRALRSPLGRRVSDQCLLKVPQLGPVIRLVVVNRFIGTLGTLLASGVATLEAFAVAERVASSYSLSQVVAEIREHVRRGEGIAAAMARSSLIPAQVTSMVEVGEETGELAEMLERSARTMDAEIDHRIKKLLVRLEPMITALLAVLVGFVVLGLYLPMFDMLGKIGH